LPGGFIDAFTAVDNPAIGSFIGLFPNIVKGVSITLANTSNEKLIGLFIMICILPPLYEEKIKRLVYNKIPYGCGLLSIYELFSKCATYSPDKGPVGEYMQHAFSAFVMHWATYPMPYWLGVVSHMLWNTAFVLAALGAGELLDVLGISAPKALP